MEGKWETPPKSRVLVFCWHSFFWLGFPGLFLAVFYWFGFLVERNPQVRNGQHVRGIMLFGLVSVGTEESHVGLAGEERVWDCFNTKPKGGVLPVELSAGMSRVGGKTPEFQTTIKSRG